MVVIAVLTRRFRCATDRCPRRIFTERLPGIVGVGARRTFRLGDVQRHVGLALGGRAGARLAARAGRIASGFTTLSCRQVARLLRTDVEDLTKPQCAYIDRFLAIAPEIATARALAGRFADMVRQRLADDLDGWLDDAENSELRSFAAGLRQDKVAVRAALTTPWSNGQTEGQITKLKLLKRQMYGRAKLDLLRARLVQAA
jgi:hypothetical protein